MASIRVNPGVVPPVVVLPTTVDIMGLTVRQAQILRAVIGRVHGPEAKEISSLLRRQVAYDGPADEKAVLRIAKSGDVVFSHPIIDVVLPVRR